MSRANASSAGLGRARVFLFLATGLAIPLFAFPPIRVLGKPVDAATIFAAAFAAASAAALATRLAGRLGPVVAILAGLAPLAVLLPPRPPNFSLSAFASSEAHWVLVVLFFVTALTLRPDPDSARSIVLAHLAAGCAVAAFALYQLVGNPRGWPGTGTVLFSPLQREPFRFTPVGSTYLGGGYMRPTSIFLEPAWMGGYLAWIVALAALWPAGRRGLAPALRIAAAALSTAAIAASVSWGAYADLLVVLAVATVSLGARRATGRGFALGVAAALLLGALALATPPGRRVLGAVAERLELLKSTAVGKDSAVADTPRVRMLNAAHAWRLFVENAPKGVGLGQFRRYAWNVPEGGQGDFGESMSRRDPWFGWITVAAEAGVLGPLVLAAAVAIVALRARGRAAALAAALCALAVVQQVHTGSYIDLWWWFPLSLAAVLAAAGGDGAALAPGPGGVR
ncbi:MAG: hypothetical protein ABI968_15365 [Acidobacteriota bacterium]